MKLLPCCRQELCRKCLYRHIVSILDEAVTGQGRSELQCPLGCGKLLPDALIRQTIVQEHPMFHWSVQLVCHLIFLLLFHYILLLFDPSLEDPFQNRSLYYEGWLYWNHSREARHVLGQYERWNLAVGLRSLAHSNNDRHHHQQQQQQQEVVVYCPAPDCGYAWTSSDTYRRNKLANEQRHFYLWYSPPQVEKAGNYSWVEPQHLHLTQQNGRSAFIEDEEVDGRRMVCAKCQVVFCGLCRLPWEAGRGGISHGVTAALFGGHQIKRSHRCVSCTVYQRRIGYSGDRDFAFVAQIANSRCCPGCSLRTVRTEGCNHMTCPCGYQWCYVCECRWNTFHYTCVDRGQLADRENRHQCTVM